MKRIRLSAEAPYHTELSPLDKQLDRSETNPSDVYVCLQVKGSDTERSFAEKEGHNGQEQAWRQLNSEFRFLYSRAHKFRKVWRANIQAPGYICRFTSIEKGRSWMRINRLGSTLLG